jgi:hypothetical protein
MQGILRHRLGLGLSRTKNKEGAIRQDYPSI